MTNYTAPSGYSLSDNMAIANGYANSHTTLENFYWFYQQVRNHGAWDYKQQDSSYQYLGNFNYGATGIAMGFPEQLLLRAAGGVQIIAGTSKDEWGNPFKIPPYGDDPADQQAIRDGINLAKDHGYSVSNSSIIADLADALLALGNTNEWDTHLQVISDILGTTPDPLVKTIKYVRYVDPLILDLNGDGLQITPLSKGILFDTNGDTIKTGTAWANADDGLLVRDRNGNGQIDSGNELFGDETILANGNKAANGFVALKELDSNGDNLFNASDSQYANLRIWRDLNQDGISQTGELKSLTDSGVQSINLISTPTNISYDDAQLVQSGSFIRSDGSMGQAGSFILAQNSFNRAFTPITVSDAAKVLPDFKGSGWVRDLQEAATLDPELITLLNQIKDSPTRVQFKENTATLLREWGNESDYNSASKQAMAMGVGLILSEPQDDQERGWMDTAIKAR